MRRTKVRDVMTRSVVTVRVDLPFKDLVKTMHEHRVSGVPVVHADGTLAGIVTEADLLRTEDEMREPPPHSAFLEWFIHPAYLAELEVRAEGAVAADVMTRAVVTIDADAPLDIAARRMLREGVKRLPVVDEKDHVVGIVSRRDLLRPFLRRDGDIRQEIVEELIHETMWLDPTTIVVEVSRGVVTLSGRVERRSEKEILAALVRQVDGVVGLVEELTYRTDDRGLRPQPSPPELAWGENWVRSR